MGVNLRAKLLAFLLGLLVCLLLLELGLNLLGLAFLSSQEALNKASLQRNGSYRILCLGDSTTAVGGSDSWPGQLGILLNQDAADSKEKGYSVINKGVVLADSSLLLSNLEKELARYDPDLVILMTGLNDARKNSSGGVYPIKRLLSSLKSYRLLQQLSPDTFGTDWIEYDNTQKAYLDPQTISNLNRIHDSLTGRGIRLVVMQYPMRDLTPLRQVFAAEEGTNDLNDLLFIDNQEIFINAVASEGYAAYFVDSFAGDFGHCTRKGNRLIASNIVNALKKEGVLPG
jgi:lysophospholipase L1-like esterase